jgi:uncharacterized membrane protein YgcG
VHTGSSDNRTRWLTLALLGAVLVAVMLTARATSGQEDLATQAAPPPRPEPVPELYNATELFTSDELSVLENDAFRLQSINIPTVVYVRIADSDDADAASTQQFADTVRNEWGIESAPGTNDGLVLLVTLDKQGKHGHSIAVSYGDATFQHSGLTPEYIEGVFHDQMMPLLEKGRYYEAMYTGIRKVRYGGIYFPPPVPPLERGQRAVHDGVSWVAPISVIAVSAMFIAMSLRLTMDAPERRPLVRKIGIAVGIWIVALAILSVYGQSAIGIASALLITISLAIEHWIWTRPRTEHRTGVRKRAVPPGSRRVRKLRQAIRMTSGSSMGAGR